MNFNLATPTAIDWPNNLDLSIYTIKKLLCIVYPYEIIILDYKIKGPGLLGIGQTFSEYIFGLVQDKKDSIGLHWYD